MAVRASLTALPMELKKRILTQVAEKPSRPSGFWRYSDGYRAMPDLSANAVSALSRVSQEWRRLAAPLLFRTLTAKQCANPVYQMALQPKYSHLVKELRLEKLAGVDPASVLQFLASFTGELDLMEVPSPVALLQGLSETLTGDRDQTFAQMSYVEDALGAVIRRSAKVFLTGRAADMVRLCSGTTITSLHFSPDYSSEVTFDTLLGALQACQALRIMVVDPLPATSTEQGETSLQPLPGPWPKLRGLEIVADHITAEMRLLLTIFASAVVELVLHFYDYGPQSRSSSADITFPSLASVRVEGQQTTGAIWIAPLSPATCPAVRNITWQPWQKKRRLDRVLAIVEAVQQLVDRFASASQPLELALWINTDKCFRPTKQAASRLKMPDSVDFHIENAGAPQQQTSSLIFKCPSTWAIGPATMVEGQQTIYESLDAVRSMVDFAVATDDRVQLAKIGEALQECE